MKKKATITVGISASGKSTWAEDQCMSNPKTGEVNRDRIRRQLMEADGKEFSWAKWNWKREKEVTAIADKAIKTFADSGYNLIVSDTNLNPDRLKQLEQRLKTFGYDVDVKTFPVTLEEAWKRDAARKDGVGHSVIAEQYEKYLKYVGRRQYVADVTKPKCILVDIDGTLAHMNGKRGAFDWDKVGLDDVDEAVKLIVNMFGEGENNQGTVICLSGRDGVCDKETREWLLVNGVWYDKLIMRAPGDMRKDTIVKEEIFWRDIADNYNVQFVIDDRPSVCRMWREIGLKVMQVGNPHIEF